MPHCTRYAAIRSTILSASLILALSPDARAGTGGSTAPRWQYAGENQGIRFQFMIKNECRESGASLQLKLENTLDHAVTVTFRLVDPDWKQSFERELGPKEKNAVIPFTPDEGTACHPYVDEVYLEAPGGPQVTHSQNEP